MAETGPPYPRPDPKSNAIGRFAIGVGQIGEMPDFDWWATIDSQFANSPRLIALIRSLFEAIDQTQNLEAFFDKIWNVDTAEGYGLDVWGRIVGINRVLKIGGGQFFGFKQAMPFTVGFGQGPFYTGQNITSNYSLSDQQYRRLIIAKAMANISDGSIKSINAILMFLFGSYGNAYVRDGAHSRFFGFRQAGAAGFGQGPFYHGQETPRMVMQYVFTFTLTPINLAIVNSGVLPRPVGVSASIVTL